MSHKRLVVPVVLITVFVICIVLQSRSASSAFMQQPQLEIHYINVGWGGSVLVKGPDGTTVLMKPATRARAQAKWFPTFSPLEFCQLTASTTRSPGISIVITSAASTK
jgi:hypothetical protein